LIERRRKETAGATLRSFDAVDAGELKGARLLEPMALLWIQLALTRGHGREFAFVMARREATNRNADPRVMMAHPQPQPQELE
jgi:hypothetical protein